MASTLAPWDMQDRLNRGLIRMSDDDYVACCVRGVILKGRVYRFSNRQRPLESPESRLAFAHSCESIAFKDIRALVELNQVCEYPK